MRILAAITCLLLAPLLHAQEPPSKSKSDQKSYGEIVKNCELTDGLFHLYTDRDDGTVYLGIKTSQIGPEFIHVSYVLDGLPELGLFRGKTLDERVFLIRRHYDRLEFVQQNTAFYFDPDNALSRASKANISEAVIASLKIVATTEDKTTHLVKANDLFLKELFTPIKFSHDEDKDKPSGRLALGALSGDRTRFAGLKNYPENSLLRVNYVYNNEQPKEWGEDDVTDARYITIAVQHALIAMPKDGFEPRFEDPRVGYFTSRVTDLTSKKSANYRDPIHRWRLEKKNPEAAKSEPVEPITWWIENTTPAELRPTIKAAVEAWNLAFESAGFTKAVVCQIQPDDADWDAGDIRRHVLRWTSSPNPPFGGYGPSFVNPRTGEILGADIMLEYVFLTNRLRLRDLITRTGPAAEVNAIRNTGQFPFGRNGEGLYCEAGRLRQENAISARASLAVAGASTIEMDELLEEALYDLVLHEVGHTLGLNHNFHASSYLKPEQLNDKAVTSKVGLTGSVMDYAPANLSNDRTKQGHYFSRVPGPYDHWAIRYGYTETSPEKETEALAAILAESVKPEHAFGNDADDMRYPGRGIDPHIMINDLSSDPIAYAVATMERVRTTMRGLSAKFPKEGESYHELRTAFTTLMSDYGRAAAVLSRHVGGVQIDRSFHGQAGAAPAPFVPVPAADQNRALTALRDFVFGPAAFDFLEPALLARLQLQRRGFDFGDLEGNEDPKIHEAVAGVQRQALDHLLHSTTLKRLVDTSLYGEGLKIGDAMGSLDSSIMEGATDTFREALQIDYIERLIRVSGLTGGNTQSAQARAQAVALLEKHVPAAPANPHQIYLRRIIAKALEAN